MKPEKPIHWKDQRHYIDEYNHLVGRHNVLCSIERVFNENMGISPKSYFSLIRYQLLWQDMIFNKNFSVLDAVEEYGYTDQSHLLKDFKRKHLMLPKNAIEYAKTDTLSRFYNTSYENSAKMESEFLYGSEKI